jgi:hypothetical protein
VCAQKVLVAHPFEALNLANSRQPSEMKGESMKRRYTRTELVAQLRERGYPITKSKLDKMCAPSVNQGPPIDSWWGPRPLYDLDQGIAWAEALLQSKPSALQTPQTDQKAQPEQRKAAREAESTAA